VLGATFPVEALQITDIEKFKEWSFEVNHHSPTTVNMNLRAIRTFLRWLVDNGHISKCPPVKQVRVDEPEVKYITETEIAELFKLDLSRPKGLQGERDAKGRLLPGTAGWVKGMRWIEDWQHYRRSFWFYLTTGCRKSEPFSGTVNGDWLDIPPHLSKNGKARNIRLNAKQKSILFEMQDRVANATNSKTAIDQYGKAFRKACNVLGIDKDKTLHSLRHTYACIRRLETNGNILLMRDELGHKSVKTTERYCNIPIRRLEQDFPSYVQIDKKSFSDTVYLDTMKVIAEPLVG